MEPWIETFSGATFRYNDLNQNYFKLEDIAHSLSNICRFTGHCSNFYSVAEHSVYVAHLLPKEKQLCGLLHDASEAFVNDLASPLKQLMPEYSKLEEQIMEVIARKFSLPSRFWKDSDVKHADWIQLKEEAVLLPSKGKHWYFPPNMTIGGLVKQGFSPVCLEPKKAKDLFLQTYDFIVRHR
ncbi:MAG: hypothetical protein QXL01_04460 [Thermoplasmatales archaeon]